MARRAEVEGPKLDRRIVPSSFAVRGRLLREGWNSYFTTLKARSTEEHEREALYNLSGSYLETLRRLDSILPIPFTKLNGEELRKVMGDKLGEYDYGWFGSLKANGQGRHEILSNHALRAFLSKFLPEVQAAKTKEDALRLAKQLYERLVRINGIKHATPTRLLAIYRPDLFFSVMGPSIQRLSILFGIPKARLKRWEGYAQALQMIWRAEWYCSSRPVRAKERRDWDARVALLDAYAYNADERD